MRWRKNDGEEGYIGKVNMREGRSCSKKDLGEQEVAMIGGGVGDSDGTQGKQGKRGKGREARGKVSMTRISK